MVSIAGTFRLSVLSSQPGPVCLLPLISYQSHRFATHDNFFGVMSHSLAFFAGVPSPASAPPSPPAPPAPSGVYDSNIHFMIYSQTDLQGMDVNPGEGGTVPASSPTDCAYACYINPVCNAWSYMAPYCFLKVCANPPTYSTSVVSGVILVGKGILSGVNGYCPAPPTPPAPYSPSVYIYDNPSVVDSESYNNLAQLFIISAGATIVPISNLSGAANLTGVSVLACVGILWWVNQYNCTDLHCGGLHFSLIIIVGVVTLL